MAAFFHLLRDRILGRSFIILQRQPEEDAHEDQKSSLEESKSNENNTEGISKDSVEDSRTSNTPHTEYHATVKISDSKTPDDLEVLYSDLKTGNSLETRCKSVLNLALCLAQDSPDVEFTRCLGALKDLCDSYNFSDLTICHALLLCSFTKLSMSLQELEMLEERILSLPIILKKKDIVNSPKMAVLAENHKEAVVKLCQKLFCENDLDVWEIDVSTICCYSLYNLSCVARQHDSELGEKYIYKNSTLKYIFEMTGRSTQEIVSEFMVSKKQFSPSISSHRVKQCLHILEHALSVNPDLSSCESFQHESFSLPHCLTRLLGWSVSSVFPGKDIVLEDTDIINFKFHLSTLVCILKILSVLTFNPNQYDSFTNVKGLMEKILICTLKAYFESDSNHFDVQILCLEMLINLYIKNQKTFVLLCLKKFKISESEEVFAVEALLKMLSDNLKKIKEVKESTPYPQNDAEIKSSDVSVKTSSTEISKDILNDDSNKNPSSDITVDPSNEKSYVQPRNDKDSSDANIKKAEKETVQEVSSESSTKNSGKDTIIESDPVLLAASKDMEHSTIVSFICVLIVFFMRTKQNFKDFILSKLTSEALREATDVSKKFLEFASLTGGMPVTGILILTQTINKLQAMQSS